MNIVSITAKFIQGDACYAFGRFYFARRLYSLCKRCFFKNSDVAETHSNPIGTLFPKVQYSEAVNNLKRDAVAFGFDLPQVIVDEIQQYAAEQKCYRSGDRKEFFLSELNAGKLQDGNSVILGFVKEPFQCKAVEKISKDKTLLAVCQKYLGYNPTKIEPRLFWSFVNDEPDAIRRDQWQTTGYHFDVDGFNFVYANFYITSVTRYSGAHVMLKNSHNCKPLRMLFHSAVQSDESVLKYFGHHNEIIIEGQAGLGFVQDSSCYHKALAPQSQNRLMLQLRIK